MTPDPATTQPSSSAKRRILLIGWDAADWKIARPLLERGEMPNLAALMARGVHGNIATIYPVLSPMLWTSIATGKRPPKHGIYGFTEPTADGQSIRPITNLGRTTKAIWNILNQQGLRSIVVGWWPSHPAEPIQGVMVSDHFNKVGTDPDCVRPMLPGAVHPQGWTERLAELRVHPTELDPAMLRLFVPELERVDQGHDKSLHALASIVAETMSVHAAATELLAAEPWDFAAIYYDSIDHFSHRFMAYHPPRLPWIDAGPFTLYQHVIANAYRYHDVMLGRLLELAGPDTTVVLLSDHGFHPDHLRPRQVPAEAAGPAVEHRHFGILVLAGPGLRQGEPLHGANVLDITPTLLQLLDLPVGEDMDGKVLLSAFRDPPTIHRIPSWDLVPGNDGRHPPETQLDPVSTAEALRQLVQLGYIAPPGPDAARYVEDSLLELQLNLARAHLDALQFPAAEALLEPLLRKRPEDHRLVRALVEALLPQGKLQRCQQVLDDFDRRADAFAPQAGTEHEQRLRSREERRRNQSAAELALLEADPKERQEIYELRQLTERATGYAPLRLVLRLQLALARPDRPLALELLEKLTALKLAGAAVNRLLAHAYLRLGDAPKARQQVRRALKTDPEDAQAFALLAQIEMADHHPESAARAAVESLTLVHFQPAVHLLLGQALMQLHRYEDAERALQIALKLLPGLVAAHEALAWLHEHVFHRPIDAVQHRVAIARLKPRSPSQPPVPSNPAAPSVADSPLTPPASPPERRNAGRPPLPPSHEGAAEWPNVPPSALITVVAGLPRTGTSMLMQMLVAGGLPALTDGHRTADADNPRGYLEYEPATRLREDASWLSLARGRGVKIVAPLLVHLDPSFHYRVIFMHRDLREVLASQQAMLQRQGRTGADVTPDQLAVVLDRQVARVVRWLQNQANVRMLHLDYSEVLAQPPAAAARINRFLGGGLDEAAMAAAVDPRLRRQKAG